MASPKKSFDKALSAEIKLAFPVIVDGVTYDSLTMRRLKTKDSLMASRNPGNADERAVALLANLCTFKGDPVGPNVIEELDSVDLDTLHDQLSAFTGRQAA